MYEPAFKEFISEMILVYLFFNRFGNFHTGNRDYRYKGTVVSAFAEFHPAIDQRKESMIFSHTYIQPRVVTGSALANDNVACLGELASVNLNTQPFAV
jgi:hypothetical protein